MADNVVLLYQMRAEFPERNHYACPRALVMANYPELAMTEITPCRCSHITLVRLTPRQRVRAPRFPKLPPSSYVVERNPRCRVCLRRLVR